MNDTPRTDVTETFCYGHIDQKWTPAHFARKLERELAAEKERSEGFREVLADVSTYLSVGSGDENTTAKKYMDRIMDGMKLHNDQSGKLIAELTEQLAAVTAEREAFKVEYESRAIWIRKMLEILGIANDDGMNCVDVHEHVAQMKADLSASQQEVARLREELAAIRNYGKGNSVWAASKESKMADAALSSTPSPVCTDTGRLDVLEICAKALRDCEAMAKNEIMRCELAETSANAWPDLLTGCVSGGGIQSAIAAIDAALAEVKGVTL